MCAASSITVPPRCSYAAHRLHLWFLALLLISGVALRIEAAIYGSQIMSTVSTLSTLRAGQTSKAETLSRLPMLKISAIGPYRDCPCNADQCFFMLVGNGFPGRILWRTRRVGGQSRNDSRNVFVNCVLSRTYGNPANPVSCSKH